MVLIEELDRGHIAVLSHRRAEVERKEIEIVERVEGVAVVFGVAADFKMASGVEERPGRRGKAQAANVEVLEPGSLLPEDPADGRQMRRFGPRNRNRVGRTGG